jgi:NADH-quinone oxidoreductase subunit L
MNIEAGITEPVVYSQAYTEAMHHAHYPAMIISLLVAGFGILMAFNIYQWKKLSADKIAERVPFLYKCLITNGILMSCMIKQQ